MHHFTEAQVAKLVDALLSGGSARNGVAVRLCSCAHEKRVTKRTFGHPLFCPCITQEQYFLTGIYWSEGLKEFIHTVQVDTSISFLSVKTYVRILCSLHQIIVQVAE